MKKQFQVSGMTCASCVATIERVLKKLEGMHSVVVNLGTEQADIDYDETKVDLSRMNGVLKSYGYNLSDQESNTAHNEHDHHASPLRAEREKELTHIQPKAVPAFIVAVVIFVFMIAEIIFRAAGREFFVPMRAWQFVQFFLATGVLFWAGDRFLSAIIRFLKTGKADMNSLVGIGTTVAYIYSTIILFFPEMRERYGFPEELYFDATIVVIGFVLFGKFLEIRSKMKTGEAIEALVKLQPTIAHVKKGSDIIDTPLSEVKVGDICVVRLGEKIPTDGVIIEGEVHIDESMITGESFPVKRTVNDQVIGSTINTDAVITIRASKIGSDTVLSRIIHMVQQAQGSKAPIQRLADTISQYFVPSVLVVAFISIVLWLTVGTYYITFGNALPLAISAFVGILVIACPCALGLATPTAIIVSTGTAARQGILVKNAESMEKVLKVDTVIFDKTGTLTVGKPQISDIHSNDSSITEDILLQAVATLEQFSDHPLAKAILNSAREKACPLLDAKDIKETPGAGVSGNIQGSVWYVGTTALFQKNNIDIDASLEKTADHLKRAGKTVVYIGKDTKHVGVMALSDVIKPHIKHAINDLHKAGIETVMMTGDNHMTAKAIAQEAGIKHVFAEVHPEHKAEKVRELQKQGKVVAMVGDGINDAPALAQADLGIAMSTGTDVAIESADITLLHGDIRKVNTVLKLSRTTIRIIRQNLFWAFFYNVVGIPLAAGVLYPIFGWMLSPVFAGMAMAFSSVSVLTNSLRLRKKA